VFRPYQVGGGAHSAVCGCVGLVRLRSFWMDYVVMGLVDGNVCHCAALHIHARRGRGRWDNVRAKDVSPLPIWRSSAAGCARARPIGSECYRLRQTTCQCSRLHISAHYCTFLHVVLGIWDVNLDDGVIINFAPLWRLVPYCKSWQMDIKTTWEALCKDKYDWAHLSVR